MKVVYIVIRNNEVHSAYIDKKKAIDGALSIPCNAPGGWFDNYQYRPDHWYNGMDILSIIEVEVIE